MPERRFALGYELTEIDFNIIIGRKLQFTLELSGHQPFVEFFPTVNKSVCFKF